jgi:hypothetical protein
VTFIRGEIIRADEEKDEPRSLEMSLDDGSPVLPRTDVTSAPYPHKAVALEV